MFYVIKLLGRTLESMNKLKSASIITLLVILMSTIICVIHADAQTVHALLVIMDDDPRIGTNVKVDRKNIVQLLGSIENELCEVETTTLLSSKDQATHDGVLQWIRNIYTDKNDILFIYYAGHGGMNEKNQTFLVTEGKWLIRSDLVNAIEQVKSPRLTLLITDCCSSLVSQKLDPNLQSSRSMTRLTERVLRNLFLEHQGFLHVTAATEKQYGWSNVVTGGWFTKNLIEALNSNPDENRDSFLTWKEVFETARQNTEKTFSQATFTTSQLQDMRRKGITSQTPKAYSFPTPLNVSSNDEKETVNYIFLAIVLFTLFISNRIAHSLKKQYASRRKISSHRSKAWGIIAIEVLTWIGFNIFWTFFTSNWWVVIVSVILILMILSRRTKKYA